MTLLGLLAALGVAGVLAACGGESAGGGRVADDETQTVDTSTAKRGGTLRLARSIEPVTLNPYYNVEGNGSLQTMAQVYDTLVEFQPGTSEAEPGLAESWEPSSDYRTWTFHLRRAQFSDGTPVTSADVKYSLERVSEPRSPYYTIYRVVRRLSAPDASTVVVTLEAPMIGFPWYLGSPAASIVSKAALEQAGDEAFAKRPLGSGPFMLKRWVKGQVVELVRNPHYWRSGQPYLDAVELLYVPNDNTRTLDLLSGNVDAVDAVPFSQVDQVDDSGQARVLFQLSSGLYSVWFNLRHNALGDRTVRQALNYATPVEQIRDVVFNGRVEVMNSILPKLKYWDRDVPAYAYDVDRARALLARTSVPDGFELTLDIVAGDQTSKQVGQILQDAWSRVGVRLKLRQADLGTMMTRVFAFEYQAYMTLPDVYTSDIPIPDQFAGLLFDSYDDPTRNGWTWYDNKEAVRLTREAIHATSEDDRARLFAELQQVTVDDPPSVPLIYPPYRGASRNDVKGYQYVQTGWWNLEQVSLDR